MITKINVGELRRIISEGSKNEFKPVVFGDLESKRINGKAYKDIEKETSKYNGGLGSKPKIGKTGVSATDNKGMHDLEYENINKPFNDRVKSQMKGYTSKDAEDKHKNDAYGNASFDNDGTFYKSAKEHADKAKENKDKAAKIGLTGRELSSKEIKDNSHTIGESRKIKQLRFKNVCFLSEGHMMSLIPDAYKKNGKRFIMQDKDDNQYLVEWANQEPIVTKRTNMKLVNEEKNRIKALWSYTSAEAKTSTPKLRVQENKEFSDMINKARQLMK